MDCSNLPAIVACTVHNNTNGWVDFEDGRLIKSSFITKDEHEAFLADQGRSPTKKGYHYVKLKKI
jgi:hypothetical protein